MLMALCHSAETGWQNVDDVTTLSDLRGAGDNLLWAEADVRTLNGSDIELIADEFDLHPLAVEDARHTRQRPKIDRYENHLFIVVHELAEVDGQLEATQIGCFLGKGFVLTLHAGAERTIELAKERWEREAPDQHPSFLLHTLLDVVVDDYQAITDGIEDEVERLEEVALATPAADIQRDLYSVKQKISRLRRYAIPESRLLERTIADRNGTTISTATEHLFRDVHDHLLRITDQVRNADDLTDAVLDLTRNAQAAILNETGRKLSAWAAIFALLTTIAGVYGMNFELIPNESSIEGFYFAIALMAVSGIGLYLYFRHRKWL
ncbi:MAG: magnesium transporter CorA family protein [Actinomycetota bacterium]|nr:magnesium transporter CorA family protein [Actinomycetota bacterium]